MMPSRRPYLALFIAPIVALAFACGGSSTTDTATGDGGTGSDATADVAVDAVTDGGTDLFPADTTKLVLTEKGGFGIAPPDGSTCSIVDSTYTLVLATRELTWKICEYSDSGPYVYRTGQTTISAADLATVETALRALRRTTKAQCGADKPSEQIVFTTPAGETTLYDDFYFCDQNDPKVYVSGLDEVRTELDKLTK